MLGRVDQEDPPRKFYGLKAREFERVNAPRPAAPAPGASAPDEAPDLGKVDVYEILQQNRAAEQQAKAGVPLEVPRKKRSLRKRDYWLMLIAAEIVLGSLGALGRQNVVVLVFAFAGMVITAVALTWIMWFVVSDY